MAVTRLSSDRYSSESTFRYRAISGTVCWAAASWSRSGMSMPKKHGHARGGDEMRRWTSRAPGLAQHLDHGALGGAAHDGVVDHDDAPAGDVLPQGVELAAHPGVAGVLARRDEGAADVAVLHQGLAVGDAAGARVPLGGGHPRLGHAHDEIRVDGGLAGEQLAHAPTGAVDLTPVQAAVGTGEVHELEDAQVGVDALGGEELFEPDPLRVHHHHLAGLDLAHEGGAHDVEGRGLGPEHPPLGGLFRPEPPQAQGP